MFVCLVGDFAIDGNIARFASGVALTRFPGIVLLICYYFVFNKPLLMIIVGGAMIHALLINETSEMLSQKVRILESYYIVFF